MAGSTAEEEEDKEEEDKEEEDKEEEEEMSETKHSSPWSGPALLRVC